jgi:hypothetical protein
MIAEEACLEQRELLDRAVNKHAPGFNHRLTLAAMHTSNGAHESCFLPKYYRMRIGKMTTGDQNIIDGLCGRARWQERMLIRGLAAT